MVRRLITLPLLAALTVLALAQPASAAPLPEAPNCPIFPADNHWNLRVDRLPVRKDSKRIVSGIGKHERLHPSFGGGLWNGTPDGIPYTVVSGTQKKFPVTFVERAFSDPGPYPIPLNAPIGDAKNPNGDHNVIAVDKDNCRLYEMFDASVTRRGWRAYAGATWDLRSNALRPDGWTSADSAGLPMLAGFARYDEVKAGRIDHALRFSVPDSSAGWIYPARHDQSDTRNKRLPQMGMRFRLKKSVNIKKFPPQTRVILTALREYGMFVSQEGPAWYIYGAPNKRWSYEDTHSMHKLDGSDFELVDTAKLPRPAGG